MKSGEEWAEEYDPAHLIFPYGNRRGKKIKISVETQAEAEEWAASLVAWFNSTCLPGEPKRKLLKVELLSC